MSTAGAIYLAREREGLVRDEPAPVVKATELEPEPARWPITECMSDRAVVEWWAICLEFGLTQ